MRALALSLFISFLGCRDEAPATTVDTGVDEERDSVVCPPPLPTAKPRTTKPTPGPLDEVLRVNHLQVEATHNSYHLKNDGGPVDWKYGHAPLKTQLESQGVRGFELDTHYNEACGRYEVFHITRFDEGTTCRVFTDCLAELRAWSDANSSHHLLFIQIEPKDAHDAATAEPRFVALEKEILAVFPRELILTPDEVKGTAPTLREAVTTKGWPTLGATRGRVLFYLDRSDAYRDAYTHGKKDLAGRLLFANADEADPFAAVLVRNTPGAAVTALVKQGFVIRTMTDVSVSGSLNNNRTQLEAALASGAHILSTDFPARVAETNYFVEVGTPSRCNPVTAPAECRNDAL